MALVVLLEAFGLQFLSRAWRMGVSQHYLFFLGGGGGGGG